MIWSLQPGLMMRYNDAIELQARQWAMVSSLALVTAALLLLSQRLDRLPELASKSLATVVNLDFKVLPATRPVQEIAAKTEPPPEMVQKPVQKKQKITPEPVTRPQEKKPKPVAEKKRLVPEQKKAAPVKKEQPPPMRQESVKAEPRQQTAAPVRPAPQQKSAPEPAVYEQAMLDTVPAAIHKQKPAYPRRAKRMNITGFVRIRFLVNSLGVVEDIEIIQADPAGIFEKTVRKAVQNWRFAPGIINGRKVATWMTTTINFKLK
jgi:protein TonB